MKTLCNLSYASFRVLAAEFFFLLLQLSISCIVIWSLLLYQIKVSLQSNLFMQVLIFIHFPGPFIFTASSIMSYLIAWVLVIYFTMFE